MNSLVQYLDLKRQETTSVSICISNKDEPPGMRGRKIVNLCDSLLKLPGLYQFLTVNLYQEYELIKQQQWVCIYKTGCSSKWRAPSTTLLCFVSAQTAFPVITYSLQPWAYRPIIAYNRLEDMDASLLSQLVITLLSSLVAYIVPRLGCRNWLSSRR